MHIKMRANARPKQSHVREYRSPKPGHRADARHSSRALREISHDLKEWLCPPSGFTAALAEAIAWMAAATATRVVIDLLLSTSAHFWIPGVLILVAPAFIAVGLATLLPQLSLLLGYRLLLVMFGLLIGGKL